MEKIKFNCSQVNELFSLMLDNELSGEDMTRVEEHLLACEYCRNEYQIWQGISRVLKEDKIDQIPSPDFSAKVISRIENEVKPKTLWAIPWKTPAAAAVAAVMLFTGTWGVSLALKADKPEATIVQQGQNEQDQQIGREGNTDVGTPGVVNSGKDVGNPQQGADSEGKDKAKDPTVNNGTKTTPPKTNSQAEVFSNLTLLSNNNKDIVTTILKLSVSDVGVAKEKVMSMASRQGGSSQVLASQKTANGELVIVRVDVSREAGVGLAAQLATQGVVTDRTEDKKDISGSYNKSLNRLNEIQYLLNQNPENKSQLEAEASGLKRQIEVWNSEASMYGIIVWLQK